MLTNANRQAAHDVDDQNQEAGHGVTAHELGSTVHGAEEIRLLSQLFTTFFGGFLVDHTGIQVGVDRHLLAGHGIQGETCIDLGNAACTLGHHKEVHDHQDDKNDETHDIVAADHELAKGRNHLARGISALMAVDQHHTG